MHPYFEKVVLQCVTDDLACLDHNLTNSCSAHAVQVLQAGEGFTCCNIITR